MSTTELALIAVADINGSVLMAMGRGKRYRAGCPRSPFLAEVSRERPIDLQNAATGAHTQDDPLLLEGCLNAERPQVGVFR